MSQLALVTGGTSGIGAAFATTLAAEGCDLVLVARDVERLQLTAKDLHDRFGVEIETITADLSTADGVARVAQRLSTTDRPVDLLVNNAGFGMHGTFVDVPVEEHERMVRVNVQSVLALSHAALSAMRARGTGDVINIASVAAFTPTFRPSATYSASKAFVVTLSEGLASIFDGTDIRVSAVCPGFVRSEFHGRAGIDMSRMPKRLWLDPSTVAEIALREHRAGKVLIVPGGWYKLLMTVVKFTPRPVFRGLVHRFAKGTSKH